jgi:hypothetical protein
LEKVGKDEEGGGLRRKRLAPADVEVEVEVDIHRAQKFLEVPGRGEDNNIRIRSFPMYRYRLNQATKSDINKYARRVLQLQLTPGAFKVAHSLNTPDSKVAPPRKERSEYQKKEQMII